MESENVQRGWAQWLRGVVALSDDPGQSPAVTWQLTAVCNSSCRGSDALSLPPQAPGTHTVHRYICRPTLIHIR